MSKLKQSNLSSFLSQLDINCFLLPPEEKGLLQISWRNTFASNRYDKPKLRTPHDIDWHIFSYNLLEHLSGEAAIQAFASLKVKEYYILSSNSKVPAVKCESMVIPPYHTLKDFLERNKEFYDLYIFHKNFRWTFVITHEEDFGPYYAESLK